MVAAQGRPVPPEPRAPQDERELWRRRREFMLEHVRGPEVPPDVLRLKAADALDNLTSIARDLADPQVGERVWDRFKVGRDESLWYYVRGDDGRGEGYRGRAARAGVAAHAGVRAREFLTTTYNHPSSRARRAASTRLFAPSLLIASER